VENLFSKITFFPEEEIFLKIFLFSKVVSSVQTKLSFENRNGSKGLVGTRQIKIYLVWKIQG
jgi:hypothetical protein